MQKQMLGILARLDGIAVRESVLATEVEIAVKHPITTDEFKREMDELLGTRRVKRSFDPSRRSRAGSSTTRAARSAGTRRPTGP